MGSGTDKTLKEIEAIRGRLRGRVEELEGRIPMVVQLARKSLAATVGAGAGGGVLWALVKRRRGRAKPEPVSLAPAPLVVNVFPKGTMAVAALAVAAYAGIKLYELTRSSGGRSQPAAVTKLPESRQRTGS
jgi:hypothetical protein